jgi:hypothetical protein
MTCTPAFAAIACLILNGGVVTSYEIAKTLRGEAIVGEITASPARHENCAVDWYRKGRLPMGVLHHVNRSIVKRMVALALIVIAYAVVMLLVAYHH